jgi:uncharacterized integral membrane protein
MMRIARFLIAYGVVSILGVLVIVFLVQNTQAEQLTFFGQEITFSQAWIMLAATASGFLFALLLLLPGRIAATLHNWTLRREARRLDEELAFQSEQRDELLVHHEQLLRGHAWLLNAYRRSHEELDQLLKEREVWQVQLADANNMLAAQREVSVGQQPIAPAPLSQVDVVPAPDMPHMQVKHEVAVITAWEELEETEDAQEETEQAALDGRAHAPREPANESPQGIQRANSVLPHDELAHDELAHVHSHASSEETPASGANRLTSRLARRGKSSRSWFRRLGERGRSLVDQGIIRVRGRGSAMWTFLRSRPGARADQHRRMSSASHPR